MEEGTVITGYPKAAAQTTPQLKQHQETLPTDGLKGRQMKICLFHFQYIEPPTYYNILK